MSTITAQQLAAIGFRPETVKPHIGNRGCYTNADETICVYPHNGDPEVPDVAVYCFTADRSRKCRWETKFGYGTPAAAILAFLQAAR